MGWVNRDIVVRHHSARSHAQRLVEVLRGPPPRRPDSTSSSAATARTVRFAWQMQRRAASAATEAAQARARLAEALDGESALSADRDATGARWDRAGALARLGARPAVMQLLERSDIAPGLLVAPGVELPGDAEIDPYATIYAGVVLGRRVRLGQGAVIGRPQRIDANSRSPRRPLGEPTLIGDEVMVGRGSVVSHTTVIGPGTRIQAGTIIAPRTRIGDQVMVGALVVFIGDQTLGRRRPETASEGIRVGRGARICTGAILNPPLEIGEEAVVGAGSLVRTDVAPRTVVVGAPARFLRYVRDDELLDGREDLPEREAFDATTGAGTP
jgi:UDP-2-acetamido-3-amino-2,3-dideoxy-glucuronate N-acetyltransferase